MNFDPNTGEPINQTESNTNITFEEQVVQEEIQPTPIEQDPIEQMKANSNKTKTTIATLIIVFLTIAVAGVGVYIGLRDSSRPVDNKPFVPDCSIVYDCELYTKSEYICKYKDNNNEEKEMKCPWTEVKESQYKKTEPPVVASKEILDEYKSHLKKNDQYNLENYDTNWINVDHRGWGSYEKVGDKGTYTDKNNNKIEYVITDIYRNGEEDEDADIDLVINDTFKAKDNSNCECGCMTYYTNKEYYIGISFACSCGGDKDIVIYDKTGKELIKDDLYVCDAVPYIENNILYYIAIQNDENNDYEFVIKKVDFNKSKITAEVVNYFNEERTD